MQALTHLHTWPTYLLAVGCLDSEAVGPESYYLRGGWSSWQPLKFMKISISVVLYSVTRGSDDVEVGHS